MQLMTRVKRQLLADPVIAQVELIPSSCLSIHGGFKDLDQIRAVFEVDTVFLFSFEQAQYTDRGLLPLGYWTVIGACFILGEKSGTNSMISGVAYDLPQRQMLCRASGVSQSKELSTPINHSQEIREERVHGFKTAAQDLLKGLDGSIAEFKQWLQESTPALSALKKKDLSTGGFWNGR